jgi:hypothetical protein
VSSGANFSVFMCRRIDIAIDMQERVTSMNSNRRIARQDGTVESTMPFRSHSTIFPALLVVLSLLQGCGDRHSTDGRPGDKASPVRDIATPRQIKRSEMSAAEQKYGIAPVPDLNIEYQPDVILVGGGADSVRSQDGNGFIWTIDATAAHANDLAPGKIIFLTNRAVGRVLGIHKDGDNLVLVLGPVDLVEVVRKADIHIVGMPIDFDEAIPYTLPDLPAPAVSLAQLVPPTPAAIPVTFSPPKDISPGAQTPAAPASPDGSDVSKLVNFKMAPFANKYGIGMRATTNAGGLIVDTDVGLHLSAPKIDLDIHITPSGGVENATINLSGAAGLTWNFKAGTDIGLSANVSGLLTPNTDFSIPVGGAGGLPIAVTVRQRFEIKTALGVRNTTLIANGDYTFKGSFKIGYTGGHWTVAAPAEFHQKANIAETGHGVSLGVSGINLGHSIKVIGGIGVAGFVAGPYFTFFSAVGLERSSDAGMLACTYAPIKLDMNGGVGYVIPQSVTSAINFILRKLNIKYQIKGEGGLSPSKPLSIVNTSSRTGGCAPADSA